MRDSGIPWIGEIPQGWKTDLVSKYFYEVCNRNNSLTERNLLSLSYGNIIKKDIDTTEGLLPASFEGYNIIEKDDIVFRFTDLQNDKKSLRTGLCRENRGIITSAYTTIRRRNDVLNAAYFHYLFHSYDICKVYYGIGAGVRQSMNYNDLRKLVIVFPPLSEQKAIANFLDGKCAEIDEAVAVQEQMIDELRAYKQSVITEAVTHGLNSNVPMRDSGIPWIGQIPQEWKVMRGKNVLVLMQRQVRKDDEVITCFRDGEVILRKLRRMDGFTLSDKEIGYQGINVGDVVIHGMDGFAGAIGVAKSKGKASPVYVVCTTKNDNNAQYIVYYLRSLAFNNVFTALSTGIRERSCDLKWNKISVLDFILPNVDEQQKIVEYIDRKCTEIDELIAIKQQKIEALKEYKKSIIYEYVTGKKDVM